MKPNATTYKLTLQPLDDPADQDGARRLRALLKAALRSYRLRCVAIEPLPRDLPDKFAPILSPKVKP